MKIDINDDNLNIGDIEEFSTKVRAILVDDEDNILIANYHNVILLPGGKVDDNETIYDAIVRELNEELGQSYNSDELEFFTTLNYFQKNYPRINGVFCNRLLQTHYFVGRYKNVNKNMQKLTEKEQKGNFRLQLVSLLELEDIILNNKNDNPRNVYFQKELLSVLFAYKNNKDMNIKKIELK